MRYQNRVGVGPQTREVVDIIGLGQTGGDGDQTSYSRPLKSLSCYFFPLLKISSVGSKGDFLLVSEHVVELLTKMYQAVLDTTQRQLPVTVTEQ